MKIVSAEETGYPTKRIKLYKYVTPIGLSNFLEHGDLKLSFRRDSNDLYECLPDGYTEKDEFLSQLGFLSFTSKPDNHPMWGNYADKFRGACLEFSFPYLYLPRDQYATRMPHAMIQYAIRLEELGTKIYFISMREINGSLNIDYRGGDGLLKCYYSHNRSAPKSFEDYEGFMGTTNDEDYLREFDKATLWMQKFFRQVSTKHPDWQYEDEYRIPVRNENFTRMQVAGEPRYFTNHYSRFATKIILGPRSEYSVWDVLNIIAMTTATHPMISKNLKVVKADCPSHSYDIRIPDVTPEIDPEFSCNIFG